MAGCGLVAVSEIDTHHVVVSRIVAMDEETGHCVKLRNGIRSLAGDILESQQIQKSFLTSIAGIVD